MHSLLIKNSGFKDIGLYKDQILDRLESLNTLESPEIQATLLRGLMYSRPNPAKNSKKKSN